MISSGCLGGGDPRLVAIALRADLDADADGDVGMRKRSLSGQFDSCAGQSGQIARRITCAFGAIGIGQVGVSRMIPTPVSRPIWISFK